ncbi:MAG TPA: DUF6179 domain-containing protein [Syntrophomonadaceae bacterium]|nr:DUF6179 domain-containing protein [Syntrophomonadaceae bacterium]
MRHSDIERQLRIKKENLDPDRYTLALLQEGYRLGMIDQPTFDSIQEQIMMLLRELIIRYTKGESTSLRVETAQRILLSLLYSIDASVSAFRDPADAIAYLKAETIKDIYEQGLELVSSCLVKSYNLFRKIKNNKMDVPILAYHSTIDEALPGFFEQYDTVFSAHDTAASIDYPLLFDDMKVRGIFYIQNYLQTLDLETQFYNLFIQEDVKKLLFNYGRVYRIDYTEALINVFEILLVNSLFSAMITSNASELSISQYQYQLFADKLKGFTRDQCSALLDEAVEKLIRGLHLDQSPLIEYIRNFETLLLPRFFNALNNDSLANVIILDRKENQQVKVSLNEGKRMDDDSFRDLVGQIMQCNDGTEKTALIISNIQSLSDFIDVLEADCLFGDEFNSLYNALGDAELSVLARIMFMEEIRSDPDRFNLREVKDKAAEMEWQTEYARFLQGLSTKRLESIEKYISVYLESG